MTKYKLTTQDLTTYKGFCWTVGEWVETSGEGDLCGPGWLHYYHSPRLAVLLNPIHADIRSPRLWEVETDGEHRDDRGLKGGCTRMRLVRELELPEYTTEQRVRFGILCAKQVCTEPHWVRWADRWLSGEDRSEAAAEAAAAYGSAEAAAAYWSADAAADAARAAAAAWSAEAAALSAKAAAAWSVATARAWARAATARAWARAAEARAEHLDLDALAQEALR